MDGSNCGAALSRRAFGRGAAALTGGALLGGFPFSALQAKGQSWPSVVRLIRSYVGTGKVANMLAVLGRGDTLPLVLGGGPDTLGEDRMADMDSLYRIYSMTKPITGMAAMMLVDEGKLSLDQPLHSVLPKFENMMVQKVYDGPITPDNLEPALRPITIRHLLTHSAGLGYSIVQQGPLAVAMTEAGVVPGLITKLPLPDFVRGKPAASLELFADRAAELPLVYQPGTRWSYSIGLDVLGRVIEVVSGQSFDSFLQDRIFGPCGMESTFFRVPASEQYRLTTNYGVIGSLLLPIDPPGFSVYLDKPPFPFGGAGLVSSARDYDRFLQMLAGYGMLDGTRVMSEAAVRMGTSDLFADTMDPADPMVRDYGFGAGGRVGKSGAEKGFFGWSGAAGTIASVNLQTGLRIGLYTQYMPSMVYPLLDEFPAAVATDLARRGDAA